MSEARKRGPSSTITIFFFGGGLSANLAGQKCEVLLTTESVDLKLKSVRLFLGKSVRLFLDNFWAKA